MHVTEMNMQTFTCQINHIRERENIILISLKYNSHFTSGTRNDGLLDYLHLEHVKMSQVKKSLLLHRSV